MGIENIKKDRQIFESAVKKLSVGIAKASPLWQDEKFSDLSVSIARIGNNSKDAVVASDRCCSSVEKFNKIAAERY